MTNTTTSRYESRLSLDDMNKISAALETIEGSVLCCGSLHAIAARSLGLVVADLRDSELDAIDAIAGLIDDDRAGLS